MCGLHAKPEAVANSNANGCGNGISSNGNGNGYHHSPNDDGVINLDQGDPKVYYPYWKKMDDKCVVSIKASEMMSYFSDLNAGGVFYQMPEFTNAVRRVHRTVGNAVADGRFIIGGTGSSHLFIVALRALANSTTINNKKHNMYVPVVCAQPYYSCYAEALKEEKSEIFQWRGDANTFKEEGPYIEVVTSPNNPDGSCRKPVVNKEGGLVICDLAYYWPQYTPITTPMDYDIMLFTLSKATGHAGSRVGWAIVKDKEIATRMINQMALMTIGTCREGQLRATRILDFIADSYDRKLLVEPQIEEGFFEYGHRVLAERWEKLRAVVKRSKVFCLPDYPSGYCNFMAKFTQPNPAFAWMECKTGEEAGERMSEVKIRTRNGPKFGVSSKYTRVSMLDSDENFNLFLERLSTLSQEKIGVVCNH